MLNPIVTAIDRLLYSPKSQVDPCPELVERFKELTPALLRKMELDDVVALFSRCHAHFPLSSLASCDEQQPVPFHRALMEYRAPRLLQRLDRVRSGQEPWESKNVEAVAKRCIDFVEGRSERSEKFDPDLDAFAVEHDLRSVRHSVSDEEIEANWEDLLCRAFSHKHWNPVLQYRIAAHVNKDSGRLERVGELETENPEQLQRVLELARQKLDMEVVDDGLSCTLRVLGQSTERLRLALQCFPVTHLEVSKLKEASPLDDGSCYDSDSDSSCSSSSLSSSLEDDDLDFSDEWTLGRVLRDFAEQGGELRSLELKDSTLVGNGSDLILGLVANRHLKTLKLDKVSVDAGKGENELFAALHQVDSLEALELKEVDLKAADLPSLSRLRNLRELTLDLRWSKPERHVLEGILCSLVGLKHLQSLTIDSLSDDLTTRHWRMLSSYLARRGCPLRHLKIGGDSLNDLRAEALAKGLAGNCSLESLQIRNPRLIYKGWSILAEALEKHPQLKKLSLQLCKFSASSAKTLAEALRKTPSLEDFQLRACSIIGGSSEFVDTLPKAEKLHRLDISELRTNPDFFARLGQTLNETPSCEDLLVPISATEVDASIAAFALALERNSTLASLTLNSAIDGGCVTKPKIGTVAARALGEALSRCSGLRRVFVEGITLTDSAAKELLQGLKGCTQLETLGVFVDGASKGVGEGLADLLHPASKMECLVLQAARADWRNPARAPNRHVALAIGKALNAGAPLRALRVGQHAATGSRLDGLKDFAEQEEQKQSLPYPF